MLATKYGKNGKSYSDSGSLQKISPKTRARPDESRRRAGRVELNAACLHRGICSAKSEATGYAKRLLLIRPVPRPLCACLPVSDRNCSASVAASKVSSITIDSLGQNGNTGTGMIIGLIHRSIVHSDNAPLITHLLYCARRLLMLCPKCLTIDRRFPRCNCLSCRFKVFATVILASLLKHRGVLYQLTKTPQITACSGIHSRRRRRGCLWGRR